LHTRNFLQALFLKADILVKIFLFFAGRDVKLQITHKQINVANII